MAERGYAAEAALYDEAFFLDIEYGATRSADCVVPIVLSLLPPVTSVVDVGCAEGTWLASFLRHGVQNGLGLDGDYVNRAMLKVPPECFMPWDLSSPIRLDLHFDLAVSLEVAEHLPASRADGFVEDLVRLAPVVLFSAAIPGQGGTNHINEQFLSYWVERFARWRYVLLDTVRARIWHDDRCAWVYRQNAVLFAHQDHPAVRGPRSDTGVDYVHPFHYGALRERLDKPTLGYLVRALPGGIRRTVAWRARRLFASPKPKS